MILKTDGAKGVRSVIVASAPLKKAKKLPNSVKMEPVPLILLVEKDIFKDGANEAV